MSRRDGKMLNNKIFTLLATAFFALVLCADAPKIHYDWNDAAVTVKPTGVWDKVNAPGVMNNASTPPGLLAYHLSENGVMFSWKSSADSSRISGQADIVGAVLSLDESLLIIAERIGGNDQPNSTRLVFINVLNNKICGGMTLETRRIRQIFTVPGMNHKILAIQQGQSAFKSLASLLLIDLKRKSVTRIGPGFDKEINSLCTDGSRVWLSFENNSSFAEVSLDDPEKEPRYCDAKKTVLCLSYNPLTRNVIACGSGICEFFSISRDSLFLERSMTLPDEFAPVWQLSLPIIPNGMLLQNRDGKGMVISSGGIVPLDFRVEPYGCILPDKSVLIGTGNRSRINNLILPECSVKHFYAPAAMRPISRNKVLYIFPRTTKPVETILVDDHGNVFKLALQGRRGRKSVVLLTDKTGVR